MRPTDAKAQHARRCGGFTLAEVMVALVFMGFLSIAGCFFLSYMSRMAAFTEHTSSAVLLAQEKLEDLLSLRLSELAGGSDTAGHFTRSWAVSNGPALTMLDVSVSWTDVRGQTNQLDTSTAVAH